MIKVKINKKSFFIIWELVFFSILVFLGVIFIRAFFLVKERLGDWIGFLRKSFKDDENNGEGVYFFVCFL